MDWLPVEQRLSACSGNIDTCACAACANARWRASAPSRGLGDTVAKLTAAVGLKPCGGCKKRQDMLNRLVPYKRKG